MKILDQHFLDLLDTFLVTFDGSCSVVRWGSSAQHQQQVNPGVKGYHPVWRAVDLIFDRESDLPAACLLAQQVGFTGIEWDLKTWHLHLDNRTALWHVVKHADKTETPLGKYLNTLKGVNV